MRVANSYVGMTFVTLSNFNASCWKARGLLIFPFIDTFGFYVGRYINLFHYVLNREHISCWDFIETAFQYAAGDVQGLVFVVVGFFFFVFFVSCCMSRNGRFVSLSYALHKNVKFFTIEYESISPKKNCKVFSRICMCFLFGLLRGWVFLCVCCCFFVVGNGIVEARQEVLERDID